jgi:hypothetical protein
LAAESSTEKICVVRIRKVKYAEHHSDYKMTLPVLLFALLIALICGALFHILRGGGGWRLLLYFGVSALGFAVGQGVSIWRGWHLLMFGALDIGMGVIGSAVFLVVGDWLSRIETTNESSV